MMAVIDSKQSRPPTSPKLPLSFSSRPGSSCGSQQRTSQAPEIWRPISYPTHDNGAGVRPCPQLGIRELDQALQQYCALGIAALMKISLIWWQFVMLRSSEC
uniref:Uncharacterized protein n=1 Tax=Amphimedon queenslandica TaxID=400682 RepID=A0A1X7U6P5_AMPQE